LGVSSDFTSFYVPGERDDAAQSGGGCTEDAMPSTEEDEPNQSIMTTNGPCHPLAELSPWDSSVAVRAYGPSVGIASPMLTVCSQGSPDCKALVVKTQGEMLASDYAWKYSEGWVLNEQLPGSVALQFFWNEQIGDGLEAATRETRDWAKASGYTLVGTLGYVFSTQQPGTVALKLYRHPTREDSWVLGSAVSERAAIAAGFEYVSTQGFIPPTVPYALAWKYRSPKKKNIFTAQNSPLAIVANDTGYAFDGVDCAFWKFAFPGTTPLLTYYGLLRDDYYALASPASAVTAKAYGYDLVETEGYVYPDAQPGTIALVSYYAEANLDNQTTIATQTPPGYAMTRIEGYAFPANR
jgi:hypothetical protein